MLAVSSELHKANGDFDWRYDLFIVSSVQTLTLAVHKSDLISNAFDIVSWSWGFAVPIYVRLRVSGARTANFPIAIRNNQEVRGL